MTLKSDAKFIEILTFSFKYDLKNLVNFHPTTQKSENFFSMGSFCSKYIKFELQNCTSVMSCLSWHWTLMQNLNKTWPCSSKNDMRNRLNFHQSTQMSEKLHFDGLFLSKTYNVSAWKRHGNYVLWHGMVMQNFKENWRVAWKMT